MGHAISTTPGATEPTDAAKSTEVPTTPDAAANTSAITESADKTNKLLPWTGDKTEEPTYAAQPTKTPATPDATSITPAATELTYAAKSTDATSTPDAAATTSAIAESADKTNKLYATSNKKREKNKNKNKKNNNKPAVAAKATDTTITSDTISTTGAVAGPTHRGTAEGQVTKIANGTSSKGSEARPPPQRSRSWPGPSTSPTATPSDATTEKLEINIPQAMKGCKWMVDSLRDGLESMRAPETERFRHYDFNIIVSNGSKVPCHLWMLLNHCPCLIDQYRKEPNKPLERKMNFANEWAVTRFCSII